MFVTHDPALRLQILDSCIAEGISVAAQADGGSLTVRGAVHVPSAMGDGSYMRSPFHQVWWALMGLGQLESRLSPLADKLLHDVITPLLAWQTTFETVVATDAQQQQQQQQMSGGSLQDAQEVEAVVAWRVAPSTRDLQDVAEPRPSLPSQQALLRPPAACRQVR
jgi:hypothetical protein